MEGRKEYSSKSSLYEIWSVCEGCSDFRRYHKWAEHEWVDESGGQADERWKRKKIKAKPAKPTKLLVEPYEVGLWEDICLWL